MKYRTIFLSITLTISTLSASFIAFADEVKGSSPTIKEERTTQREQSFVVQNSFLSASRDQELESENEIGNLVKDLLHGAGSELEELNSLKLTMAPLGTPDSDSFSDYLEDYCNVKATDVTNEGELRKLSLRRCKDGTVSFVQPPSKGYDGYEGKCGQTAASNLMYSYCKLIVSPKTYTESYLSDYSPGVRPGTLSGGLDDMFTDDSRDCPTSRDWHAYSYDYKSDYVDAIRRGLKTSIHNKYRVKRTRKNGKTIYRTPVALLIRVPGGQNLHWVTVVDLIKSGKKCDMYLNHWDNQYKVPCSKVAKWSRGVENSYGILLSKYYVIKYK